MQNYFITGTGTGIGKTYITSMLARKFKASGMEVCCLKPIASGVNPDIVEPESDAATLLAACGLPIDMPNIEAISPWRFAAPLSPDIAAAREGRQISVDEVVDFCRRHEALNPDTIMVEGAGGIMTPVSSDATMLDVAASLGYRLVLVTGGYLGAISHTLAAYAAAVAKNLEIAAIIISDSGSACCQLQDIAGSIASHVERPVVIVEHGQMPETEGWL